MHCFRRLELTSIILAESPADHAQLTTLGVEDYVCDMVVILQLAMDRAAQAFRTKYLELKAEGVLPDKIFFRLHVFARGSLGQEPRLEAAVLSVLAYLFEECDIFEPAVGEDAR